MIDSLHNPILSLIDLSAVNKYVKKCNESSYEYVGVNTGISESINPKDAAAAAAACTGTNVSDGVLPVNVPCNPTSSLQAEEDGEEEKEPSRKRVKQERGHAHVGAMEYIQHMYALAAKLMIQLSRPVERNGEVYSAAVLYSSIGLASKTSHSNIGRMSHGLCGACNVE